MVNLRNHHHIAAFKKREHQKPNMAFETANQEYTEVPKYGIKLRLNHKYPEPRSQGLIPPLNQIWAMLPLILRYIWYFMKHKIMGKSIVMDYLETVQAKPIYGVPLGGIGAGTIGRGFRGEFCRFQMIPGLYEYNTVEANQFIVTIKDVHGETIFQSLLSCFPKKKLSSWESLIDPEICFYTGLYPRSWTTYDLSKYGVVLTCRQVSPVIPNDYQNTSLPCAVFVWQIENTCDESRTVTISFMFKNGTGHEKIDRKSNCSSQSNSGMFHQSVILSHTIDGKPCHYSVSVRTDEDDVAVTKCLYFDPNADGSEPWYQLKSNGAFDAQNESGDCEEVQDEIIGEMGCGIAAQTTIAPGSSKKIENGLVWHMPDVQFLNKTKTYQKYYTKTWGSFGNAADTISNIMDHVFRDYDSWETLIYQWQKPILENTNLPDWYKGALFNETYFVSDGGSIWVALDEKDCDNLPSDDIRRTYGKFGYLEGHEYKMYNTYDVHFYASFALAMNWPVLQQLIQYDMRDAIFTEIPEKMKMLYDGDVVERKKPNTVPHDIGDPGEEPFVLLNSYPIHDVSTWRDLNVKFVLQVFRDIYVQGVNDESTKYLRDMYDACFVVMRKTQAFDIDDDGLIENSGTPDQTFDTWIMTGSSAYCGSLWLAAVFAMKKLAEILHKDEDKVKFDELLRRGCASFEKKLWNGSYYNFDCSQEECKSIMADQLCGHWYIRAAGFKYEVFPKDHVQKALKTIYQNNVLSFSDGQLGAVNGFINGAVDQYTIQSMEVWTGVTYALASSMIQEGMWEEGFKTAGGMFESMWGAFGLAFQTPEALYETKYYRSISYMRPLSIWSMQLAVIQANKKNQNS